MAAEVASMTNGYAPHNGYGGGEVQNNAFGSTPASQQSMYQQPQAQELASSTGTQSDIPKDEVGWYFVEQYYTTLSRSPEKLYLFYNKRSQFVSGQETDKVPVCVGQRAINDRIKELEFQDCKVRVTNVDSQASENNIVIQVIGEISNKSQPHKKFTQTFVLATQTNGYFVLNDIFRYLIEEEDEDTHQAAHVAADNTEQAPVTEKDEPTPAPVPAAAESGHETLTSSDASVAIEQGAEEVDKKLEEVVAQPEETAAIAVNGDHAGKKTEEVEEAAPDAAAEPSEPEVNGESNAPSTEEALPEEKPKDPLPSPAPTPAAQAPSKHAAPPKPAVPKTWASLAASANKSVMPAVPQAPSQPRPSAPKPSSQTSSQAQTSTLTATPAAAASAPTPAAFAPATTAAPRELSSTPTSQGEEWTAVSSSHNRSQSRQVEQPVTAGQQGRGYIKNVQDHVKLEELRAHLEQFGELIYFDISRPKTSAFVDFKSPASYQAAVAANPHNVCDSVLHLEARRIRTEGQFGPGRGGFNPGQRGRGGPGQGGPPRGVFGGDRGRGGFAPRGRGAPPGGPARGRGAPAPA
ncbi:hypothetical protein LTR62_005296 [Meristemomyces frigidus]|uniref:NTF2 domain-containing protein n=1 Tax=Meristemomyces frigidus TaxID=1508187 RepID=A0AAN7TFI2_9PEZI|nr:hypothetical protein LTR62_005296 [Meristemomyces frigidus]